MKVREGWLADMAFGLIVARHFAVGTTMQVVRELDEVEVHTAIHPRRRVVVLLRDDGHFAVAEQYHYVSEYEGEIISQGWQTLPPSGIFVSAELAEAEALAASAHLQSVR